MIPAYIVTGFLEAGKTSYIKNFMSADFFHKKEKGRTLILMFENGEINYDEEWLKSYKAVTAVYESGDIRSFIRECMDCIKPDRIFAEHNAMKQGLMEILKEELNPLSTTMLIDATTLPLYFRNMTQLLQDMISSSDPVITNRSESADELNVYETSFRVMNPKAGFLRESPLGYHERIFGRTLPFDRTGSFLKISEADYTIWYLDISENPAVYAGKEIEAGVEIREECGQIRAGRVVMTCCMNDLSFLGFEIRGDKLPAKGTFVNIRARIELHRDERYKRDVPVLILKGFEPICIKKSVLQA